MKMMTAMMKTARMGRMEKPWTNRAKGLNDIPPKAGIPLGAKWAETPSRPVGLEGRAKSEEKR
jgi:hypothetical protein